MDALSPLDDDAAGGEVGAGHESQQLLEAGVGELDEVEEGVAQLTRVVGRDARRHADGDARGAVGQEVGEARRQDDGLLPLPVIGVAEIDRVIVEAIEQGLGDGRQAGLGVAHGGGVIAVDIAEVALSLDQRIAHGEVLGQAHHGVVDGDVAMGVVLADDLADDAGAFLEPGLGLEPQKAHGVEEAPVDRLQPVAHVGQGARDDGRERVGQIALSQRVGERRRADLASERCVSHISSQTRDIVAGRTRSSTSR